METQVQGAAAGRRLEEMKAKGRWADKQRGGEMNKLMIERLAAKQQSK